MRSGERKRHRYEYKYDGHVVCRKAFSVLYATSESTLKRLIKHVNQNGNVPRIHGNKGRKPRHSLVFEDVERAVKFVIAYGNDFGIPQPAAPRGGDGNPPTFLNASETKKQVHFRYTAACDELDCRAMQYKAFIRIWSHCCPHIKVGIVFG